jgi:hypothetical protein
MTLAVAVFVALTLAAMVAITVATREPSSVAGRPPELPELPEAFAGDPTSPVAPLVVLPPPAPAPAPYVPPAGVRIETLPPPPPVAAEPERRAEQLVAFREFRRSTAMDQLNAREALRRQRLGLPPPTPAALAPGSPLPREAGQGRGSRPNPRAHRPGPTQEHATP